MARSVSSADGRRCSMLLYIHCVCVCACVCACVYRCMYAYIYISTYIYLYMYIYVYICLNVCMYAAVGTRVGSQRSSAPARQHVADGHQVERVVRAVVRHHLAQRLETKQHSAIKPGRVSAAAAATHAHTRLPPGRYVHYRRYGRVIAACGFASPPMSALRRAQTTHAHHIASPRPARTSTLCAVDRKQHQPSHRRRGADHTSHGDRATLPRWRPDAARHRGALCARRRARPSQRPPRTSTLSSVMPAAAA